MGRLGGDFQTFFTGATGSGPFAFQQAFANELHQLVNVPTGLGKTAMVVVGWLWRRNGGNESIKRSTPRRLVYCLPMRVLVEQTFQNVNEWIEKAELKGKVDVHVLMGGEELSAWDTNPERDAIIIGTQDMLISRALNRGYAMSRARWPMAFGLLNTDSLWVFDEIQLMGSGLATTAQLEAFRHSLGAKDGNGCRSVWMSATMQPDWLATVDFKAKIPSLPLLKLEDEDLKHFEINKRRSATKPLKQATATMGDAADLATEIRAAHKPGTLTVVVMNTVKRACELFDQMNKSAVPAKAKKGAALVAAPVVVASPKLVLLHSRFRPEERTAQMKAAFEDSPSGDGTIVISTQVIEAGVDVSAATLFTELAPWASLVQRFGRCNRFGTANELASVRWIGLPAAEKDAEKLRFPYELSDLRAAEKQLRALKDVGVQSLPHVVLAYKHTHVIRRKDLIDLFDTTADLSGNDIDIDRFVREIEETDVRVFWREWEGDTPSDEEPQPTRGELCPVPIGEFRKFVEALSKKTDGKELAKCVYRRDFLEGMWIEVDAKRISPGQVCMLHIDAGGYEASRGWDMSFKTVVSAAEERKKKNSQDDYDDDGLSITSRWQTIAEHTNDVCRELDSILKLMSMDDREQQGLRDAARWHDWGKAHSTFQDAIKVENRPSNMAASRCVAKAPGVRKDQAGKVVESGFWKRYHRTHFRHELASALAVLQPSIPIEHSLRDLVAYLIAAHHGKVRVSIRSFPEEKRPTAQQRFARGVWDGDDLPSIDLGGATSAPAVTLSLEPMELGLCETAPFVGEPSWIERVLTLREEFGPFRLAYLEAILRAADEGASEAASTRGATNA